MNSNRDKALKDFHGNGCVFQLEPVLAGQHQRIGSSGAQQSDHATLTFGAG
jgi:hypothetical protein